MEKNAFTLIELLAVIIIIGLLSIIVIPNVNTAIQDSKKNTKELSSYALVREANNYYLNERGKGISFTECTYNFSTNTNTCDGFEFSGKPPELGKLIIKANGTVALAVKFDNYCYLKEYDTDQIETINYEESTCKIEEN